MQCLDLVHLRIDFINIHPMVLELLGVGRVHRELALLGDQITRTRHIPL